MKLGVIEKLTFEASRSSKSPHEHEFKTTTRVDPLFSGLRIGLLDRSMKEFEKEMEFGGGEFLFEIWKTKQI